MNTLGDKHSPLSQAQLGINRRHFFGKSATGIGVAALSKLLQRDGVAAVSDPKLGLPDAVERAGTDRLFE